MNRLRLITLLGGTLLFTACGGGSGNDADTDGGGGTEPGNSTVTLTADIVQQTLCRTELPATNAELVVYDSNWAIQSRHTPDTQGKITATIPATQFVNIAVITKEETSAGSQIYVQSRAQHPIGDLGKFIASTTSTQGCECQTKDVQVSSADDFSFARTTLVGTTSPVTFQRLSPFSGYFEDAQICRTTAGVWPTLTVFTAYQTEMTAGTLSDYNINAELDVQLDQFATYHPVNVDENFNNVRIIHEIDFNMISSPLSPRSTEVPVITGLDTLTRAHLSGTYFNQVTQDGQSVNIFASRRKAVDFANNNTTSISMPDTIPLEGLALAFEAFINSESNDYSIANADQYSMFSIRADLSLMDGTKYSEVFYGPMLGKYPDNVLPADYNMEQKLEMVSDVYLELSLTKYASETNYQSALSGLVKKSRADDDEIFSGDWADFSSLSIAADLNL